jgi:hypothetical protein
VAVLAEVRRKAEEMRELHASSPGTGEGNCRRFVVINTSHSDSTVSAVPRHALTFLSIVFRCMSIRGLTLIGRGHFSEVYSCKDLNGHPTGRVVKVSNAASNVAASAVFSAGCNRARQVSRVGQGPCGCSSCCGPRRQRPRPQPRQGERACFSGGNSAAAGPGRCNAEPGRAGPGYAAAAAIVARRRH